MSVPPSDSLSDTAAVGEATGLPPGRPRVVSIGEHRIHALEFGEGEQVLVMLHGLSGSWRWWDRNIPELAGRYRVVVPDLIGFGRSRLTGTLPSIDRIGILVARWLESLELGPVCLAGHSMGGQISIHAAVAAPELIEKLVIIDSAGIPRPLSPRSLIRFAAEVAPLWRWGDPRFLPVIAGDAWTAGPRVLMRSIHHILRDDVRPILPQITAPTLVIWGERDTLVPLSDAWEFRRLIPDSRLAVLRSAAHNPMVDRPPDFNRLLIRFLDGEPVGR
jgi:pimeloyl-ACP methyl ester carboxylesterase